MTTTAAAPRRPYWFRDGSLEGGVYLGVTKGQWPLVAFASATHAASWAAESPQERVLVGPIKIPDDAPVLSAKTIPERIALVDGDDNEVES